MRGRVSNTWEKRWVRDRSPVMRCPSYVGSCVSVQTRTAVFSLNSNIKTAQVSLTLPLRQLSASHNKCTMDCTSNQCLDQGPLPTRFSINMYILLLTPLHLPPRPSFFLFLFKDSVVVFFPPAPPEASFCWGAVRAYTAFSNEEGRFAFSISPSVLFCLPVQQLVCLHFCPLLHSSSPRSSCYFCPPFVHSLFSYRTLFQSPTFNWLVSSHLTPHPSTYLDCPLLSFLSLSPIKTLFSSLSQRVRTLR